MPAYEPVTAALRCIAVLREVSVQRSASARSIQAKTKLSRATIIRMLETLEYAGLIARDPTTGLYFVTGKSLELSMGYQFDRILANLAAPILDSLRTAIGWPSDLAIFDEDAMMIVATNRVRDSRIVYNYSPGYRSPVLGSALGRAYLAFSSEEVRASIFHKLKSISDPWNDAARDPVIAAKLVDSVRRQRYATPHKSFVEQIHGDVDSIAVPVLEGDRPVAVLNVVYFREALTPNEAALRLVEPLKAAADVLGRELKSASPRI
jgi:IclR family transcriptional regulator, mhp operon transcriptional activator